MLRVVRVYAHVAEFRRQPLGALHGFVSFLLHLLGLFTDAVPLYDNYSDSSLSLC
jgi:hypothetical protein